MPERFTDRLAAEIARKSTTKTAVAKAIGVHRATLHEWASGAVDPSVGNLAAMADFFGCSMDWLWGRSAVRESPTQTMVSHLLASVPESVYYDAVDAAMDRVESFMLTELRGLQEGTAGSAGQVVTSDEAQAASEAIGENAEKARGERPSRSRRGAGGRPA